MLQQYRFTKRGAVLFIFLLSGAVAGCATSNRASTPRIEDYTPRPIHLATVTDETMTSQYAGESASATDSLNEPAALSLAACIEIALDHNPASHAAHQGVISREASVGIARAPYYPEASIAAGYSRWQKRAYLPAGLAQQAPSSTIGPTHDWMGGVTARYPLYDGGRRAAELRKALALKTVAEEELNSIRLDLIFEVQSSFYQLAAATEIYAVAEHNLARTEAHLDLAHRRKEAGAVAAADVLRSEVEIDEAQLALTQAESLARTLHGRLSVALGLPAASVFNIITSAHAIEDPLLPEPTQIIEEAVQASPEIRAALQQIAAYQSGVAAARSAYHPRLYAEANYSFHEPDFPPSDREWSLGVTANWTLFSGFSRKHEVNRAKAELSRQEALVQQRLLQLEQEVWTAYSRVLEMWKSVLTTQSQVAKAQESLRVVLARYEVGVATINDLLDTQVALARAETNQAEVSWNYRIAQAWLQRLWMGEQVLVTHEDK